MRKIDIFLSFAQDVEKERITAERVIRSVSAEFSLPIIVSSSNWLRGQNGKDSFVAAGRKVLQEYEPALNITFWEYQNDHFDDGREEIPNTGQFDLVVCVVGTQLGPRLAPVHVMPDGKEPTSATDYEIAWVLDQVKRTPGFPVLRIYRKGETSFPAFESKEQWEIFAQRYRKREDFFRNQKNNILDFSQDYQHLGDFEKLFKEDLRTFLTDRLRDDFVSEHASGAFWKGNPFLGLESFADQHSPIFFGRTKASEEIIKVLESQRCERQRLVLIAGAVGSGKSSLIQAGILPLLTQSWNGRWRQAIVRSLEGDPFAILAKTLLDRSSLPSLKAEYGQWQDLAIELREEPASTALRLKQTLQKMVGLEITKSVRKQEGRLADHRADAPGHQRSRRTNPNSYLVLVVDQLEQLAGSAPETQRAFIRALGVLSSTEGIFILAALRSDGRKSQELAGLVELTRFRYEIQLPTREEFAEIVQSSAEAAGLIFGKDPGTGRRLDEVLVEAALASSEPLPLLELALSELYRKQSTRGDGMLSWDDYQELSQVGCDFPSSEIERPVGLERAIAYYAENQLAGLGKNQLLLFWPILRQLIVPGPGGTIILQTIPYPHLVRSPEQNKFYQLNAKILVDHLVEAGLLRSFPDPEKSFQVSLMHEVLVRKWPRLWRHFCQERDSVERRQQLELQRQLWEEGGRQKKYLLAGKRSLEEGEILQREFRPCLTGAQLDFLSRSLGPFSRKSRRVLVLAAVGIFAVCLIAGGPLYSGVKRAGERGSLALKNKEQAEKKSEAERQRDNQVQAAEGTALMVQAHLNEAVARTRSLEQQLTEALGGLQAARTSSERLEKERSSLEVQLKKESEDGRQARAHVDEVSATSRTLEGELQGIQEKLQLSQAAVAKLESQRLDLQTQLKKEEERGKQVEADTEQAVNRSSILDAALKDAQRQLQIAQTNVEQLEIQRTDLQKQLKDGEGKIQQFQEVAAQAAEKSSALESELGQMRDKLQIAQAAGAAVEKNQLSLEGQLRDEKERGRLAEQSFAAQLSNEQDRSKQLQRKASDSLTRSNTLEFALQETEEKLRLAQNRTSLLESQRDDANLQLRNEEEKIRQAEANVDAANVRTHALETELRDAQGKAQVAQTNAAEAERLRNGLQLQLKNEQEKTQQAQQDAEQARAGADEGSRQSKTLEIKKTQDEQLRGFQALMEMARVTTGNPPARPSLPSSVAKAGALPVGQSASTLQTVPSKEKIEINDENPPDEESLKGFVLDYLQTIAVNDVAAQERFFADRVNFYSRGVLPLTKVQDATQEYHEEWPQREWLPRGSAAVSRSSDPNFFVVRQPFTWKVSDGAQSSQGDALLYLKIRKSASGEFRIVKVQQKED